MEALYQLNNLTVNNKRYSENEPVLPRVETVYSTFPANYVNNLQGWGIDRETLKNNAGLLLTLDIDFGSACSLNCLYCFKTSDEQNRFQRKLQYQDYLQLIEQAKELGLRSVKILGAGEPFEEKNLVKFLRFLAKMDVIPVVFTKANNFCSDSFVKKLYGDEGIYSTKDLVNFLNDVNASLVVSANSFIPKVQAFLLNTDLHYYQRLNSAIELLCEAGFNNSNPTRLAIGVNPVTKWNIAEAYDLYVWARERNIYPVVTPTMVAGIAKTIINEINPTDQELIELYRRIYQYNLANGIQTEEQLKKDGVSAYAGGHPCNQVVCGLYLSVDGFLFNCPGRDDSSIGSVFNNELSRIWRGSNNYSRRDQFNCRCIAKDGLSLPLSIYMVKGETINDI